LLNNRRRFFKEENILLKIWVLPYGSLINFWKRRRVEKLPSYIHWIGGQEVLDLLRRFHFKGRFWSYFKPGGEVKRRSLLGSVI